MRPKRLAVVAVAVVICLAACGRRSPSVALPPPAAIPVAVSPLDQPDSAFAAGNYDEAARGYENYLRQAASSAQRDQALFRLGLSYVSRPAPDWPRALTTFKQVVDEYPNSPLKPAAILILSLRTEVDKITADTQQRDQRIRQLTSELDRLRKIDADRRKRP
jgi:hypothetical protein